MSPADAFEPLRSALERAGIRFAIGGSWASTAFGEPRFTNDVDLVAEFTQETLEVFIANLPDSFYLDAEDALIAVRLGRPFNVIHMPTAFKFDFFPAAGFTLGMQELDRAVYLNASALSAAPAPFVTPEDILLAKLYWFRLGGEVSEVQWRDIEGIVRACGATLDRKYLQQSAAKAGVGDLLEKALKQA
ncbi:MAG TPA: hypothetical protein VMF91_25980 [Bryobacteraceae bacterium]|nr:hypothetical protein [Bryobacteraceae bacterium]